MTKLVIKTDNPKPLAIAMPKFFINFVFVMTKDGLVAKLCDIELDDFEAKAAKSDLPKNIGENNFNPSPAIL